MTGKSYTLEVLPGRMAVVRLRPSEPFPPVDPDSRFFSVTRTDEEISIIGPERKVPAVAQRDGGWRALRVRGPLAFGEIGVLATLARTLAEAEVSILAVSTYRTDTILVKEPKLELAIRALREAGHEVEETPEG